MTKYIEWSEPYSDGLETIIMRMSFANIVTVRRREEPCYTRDGLTDEQVLEDFRITHWGWVVELPDGYNPDAF